MASLSPWETFIQSLLTSMLGRQDVLTTLLRQMSFGLIDVVPPPDAPSLTSQITLVLQAIQETQDMLTGLATGETIQFDAVLAAIAALPDGSGPVVLPTSPPTGYGSSLDAAGVWTYNLGPDDVTTGDMLEIAGHLARNTNAAGALITGNNRYFQLEGAIGAEGYYFVNMGLPSLNPMNITAGQTRLEWLTAEIDYVDWILDASNDLYYFQDRPPSSDLIWRCMIDEEWFNRLQVAAVGAVTSQNNLPPVWPGFENVTLGDTFDIAPGLTITAPMDGVIVTLIALPTKSSFFTFDDINSYRNIGAISFFTDDGEQEFPQGLGFTSAIYCPKTMAQAAGVKLRTVGGVSGTVIPWVRTV